MSTIQKHTPALLLIAFVAIGLIGTAGRPAAINMMVLIGIYALMATSLGMLYGQAGIMSLSQAAFAAIGAYSTAILTVKWGLPPIAGLGLAMVLPALFAYPFARLIVRLSPLALALATLFLGKAVQVLLNQGGDFTGGYIGIGGIPPLKFIDPDQPMHFAIVVWIFVVIAVFLYTNLVQSAAGRALNTLRVDALRSQADGDRGVHRLSMLFAFAAGLAGIGGWLYAHYMSFLAPESLDMHLSLTLLLMVLVGGSRNVLGPVLGAAVLTYLNDKLPDGMQGLVYGSAVVLVLVVAPHGVLGTVGKLWQRKPQPSTNTN